MSPTASEQTRPQANPAPANAPIAQAPADDIIDLRVYIGVLVRWWKEILLIGLLFGLVVGIAYGVFYITRDSTYSASADAAIVRTVTEVTLDERFVTTADTPAATAAASRRNALIALAENPALALEVITELGDQLPEALRDPATLASRIRVEMAAAAGRSGDSDLIRIIAVTRDPELSAAIATSWTQAYVRNINQIYGQVPDELFNSIAIEQETSRINYESAQQALEEFLARSRVDELTRAVSDEESVINLLRGGRNSLLSQLISGAVSARSSVARAIGDAQSQNVSTPIVAEQEAKRNLVQAYVDTVYQTQASVIQQQGARDRRLLEEYYTRWVQVSSALGDAIALREQTSALDGIDESGSGSSALVLSLLKLQAFTAALDTDSSQEMALDTPSSVSVNATASEQQTAASAPGVVQSSQPVQVQIGATPLQIQLSDGTEMTNAQIVAEVDALIAALTERRDVLQSDIERLGAAILAGENLTLATNAPSESALAETLPATVSAILGSSIITTTASALDAVSSWEIGDLAGLYSTADLQALAMAGADDDALSGTIAASEAELRALKSELEAERTTQNELTLARDLAQDAYRAANSKKTELTLARAGAGGELRFAAPAIPQIDPVTGISPILVAMAATFAGLVLGIIYAFIADAMGQPPFLSRRSSRKSTLAPA